MDTSTPRDRVLEDRIARLRRTLTGLDARRPSAVHAARTATRRLRELVPLMGFEKARARKVVRRLRKTGRQLGRVRDLDTQAQLIDRLLRLERMSGRVLRAMRDALAIDGRHRWQEVPAAKLVARLNRVLALLTEAADLAAPSGQQAQRALRWAAQARITRRAEEVREAVHQAGAIYEPEQLHRVRIAVKKLRYAAEVALDAGGALSASDIALLKRVQDILGRQREAQVFLDRVRETEKKLGKPSIATWRETERVIALLDTRCRRYHAKFMRERTALVTVCGRLAAIPASAWSRRRVG